MLKQIVLFVVLGIGLAACGGPLDESEAEELAEQIETTASGLCPGCKEANGPRSSQSKTTGPSDSDTKTAAATPTAVMRTR